MLFAIIIIIIISEGQKREKIEHETTEPDNFSSSGLQNLAIKNAR
jgi:hypothetical protein